MREIKNNQVRPGNRGTRFLGVLLCILLAAGLGAAVVCCYPTLWKEEKKVLETQETEETQRIDREIAIESYAEQTSAFVAGLYVDWITQQQGTVQDPWEILGGQMVSELAPDRNTGKEEAQTPYEYELEEYQGLYDEQEEYRERYEQEREKLRNWYYELYPRLAEEMQLQYYIQDNVTGEGKGTLNLNSDVLETAPFVIKLQYNENGWVTVLEERGVTGMQQLYESFYEPVSEMITWTEEVQVLPKLLIENHYGGGIVRQVHTSEIKNVTITLVCDNNWYEEYYANEYYYSTDWRLRNTVISDYLVVAAIAFAVLIAVVLILSFVRPLGLPTSWMAKIPLEILVIVIICYLVIMGLEGVDMIVGTQEFVESAESLGDWQGMLKNWMTKERENQLLYLLNWAAWSGMFLCCIPGVLHIRQMFALGLRQYIKEYTLVGSFCRFIARLWRRGKKLVCSVREIDFGEKGNRTLRKAVLINLAVIVLLCCTWIIGIAGAVLYSMLLLVFLTSQYKKIQQQYQNVHEMAARMAEGKLDAVYTGDCGAFTGLSEELSRVQQGFQTAVAEEVKSQRMKTELITNVSHDLKTPLTAIITYVDLLKNPELPAGERESYIEILEQKSSRLKVLIEDLFEVSKANSGTIALHPAELDLVALLQEVQIELEDKIMQSGIEFRMNLPLDAEGKPAKLLLMLDGEKTSRIFENLIVNIVKYGMPGSRAYIDVIEEERAVCVTLKNMSRTELNFDTTEITERFVRGDASRNTEGSGLGLAIAKSFAEAQGGSLEIQTDGDLFKAVVSFKKPER